MALDRPAIRALRFGKLLGTGSGDTFAARDVDVTRWALLSCWDTTAAAEAFERSRPIRRWDALATQRARISLRPLQSRGRWSGRQPFGAPPKGAYDGPVAALTRARLRPRTLVTFWRAVPPVARSLPDHDGLLFRMGIGEAPVGTQGTFSIWSSASALHTFAYDNPAHAAVIRRTTTENWYAEELFARFAVLDVDGTIDERAHWPIAT
jgi:hypothetical protein